MKSIEDMTKQEEWTEIVTNPYYFDAPIAVRFDGLQTYQKSFIQALSSDAPILGKGGLAIGFDGWTEIPIPKSNPIGSMMDSADTNPETALKAILAKAQRHL